MERVARLQRYFDGRVIVYAGSCLDVLPTIAFNCIDAVVTDPPYELKFMGKAWDGTGIAFRPETWVEVLNVLKPGGYLAAFAAPRNVHRMVCAIEDAGFEIRDQLLWMFGTGFPKNLDVAKAIDKQAGIWRGRAGPVTIAEQPSKGTEYKRTVKGEPVTELAKEWDGWGTALKPAYEPICLARKPLDGSVAANIRKWGTGAINIDGCRVPTAEDELPSGTQLRGTGGNVFTQEGLIGYFDYDGSKGRWPANVMHDGSKGVTESFPRSQSTDKVFTQWDGHFDVGGRKQKEGEASQQRGTPFQGYGDAGSVARYFAEFPPDKPNGRCHYTAKADDSDRIGSMHPTIKPLSLMQWLVRLVTPKHGLVLDPFAGTGPTGEAAWWEGFDAVLIERDPESLADIANRMAMMRAGPDNRAVAAERIKQARRPPDDRPWFRPED